MDRPALSSDSPANFSERVDYWVKLMLGRSMQNQGGGMSLDRLETLANRYLLEKEKGLADPPRVLRRDTVTCLIPRGSKETGLRCQSVRLRRGGALPVRRGMPVTSMITRAPFLTPILSFDLGTLTDPDTDKDLR